MDGAAVLESIGWLSGTLVLVFLLAIAGVAYLISKRQDGSLQSMLARIARVIVFIPAVILGSWISLRHRQRMSKQQQVSTEFVPGLATPLVHREDSLAAPQAASELELSVVIPFYNPGEVLVETIERTLSVMRSAGITFEVIAVSDGSTDGSEHLIIDMAPEVRVIVNEVNRGKGAAVRTGMLHSRGAYVGFVDCDGDIDPAHLLAYLFIAEDGQHDIVYADKLQEQAESGASLTRRTMSVCFSTATTVMFDLEMRDTQTGCKLLRRDVMIAVLATVQEDRFAFDIEMFLAAHELGHRNAVAAPVEIRERVAGSTVSARSALRTMTDTSAIFARRSLTRRYQTADTAAPAQGVLVKPVARQRPSLKDIVPSLPNCLATVA